mmetsp:Transcript_19176/g.54982  ORF Transcript_19176/g.54982 Transcript_19176/m.54982 type:complete len:109 (+) Transcript_19176:31-357(+)
MGLHISMSAPHTVTESCQEREREREAGQTLTNSVISDLVSGEHPKVTNEYPPISPPTPSYDCLSVCGHRSRTSAPALHGSSISTHITTAVRGVRHPSTKPHKAAQLVP